MNRSRLKVAVDALKVIKIYCQTAEVSGHDDQELILLRSEFEPILDECDKALREIEEL